MDKLVEFFKNPWLKRAVALLCWGYTALMVWVVWLSFGFYFEYENATALFVLYLFVNIAALGLMIYTRKQVITMINVMLIPPVIFALVIFGFGNWYMILPPLCVVVAMFFICDANETLKTVLGTMYLLLYVVGVVAYIAINLLMNDISFLGVDLHLRDADYEVLSSDGEYRIVRYVDEPDKERRTASYYVEYTVEDVEIPFGLCKKVYGCERVLTSKYTSRTDDPIKWIMGTVDGEVAELLDVEGSLRENPYLVEEIDTSETGESAEDTTGSTATDDVAETVETVFGSTDEATAEVA